MKAGISRLLPLCLGTALLSGCAFTTDKIDLSYNPRGVMEKVSGAEAVKVEVRLTDSRKVQDKVGKKINGFGSEMGAIVSTTDVVELTRSAIETELTRRGFAKGDAVVVLGDLAKFYNQFKTGFWSGDSIAELILGVQVKSRDGRVMFNKNIVAEGVEPNIQIAGGHNAKASLERALWKAIQDLFEDPLFTASLFKAAGVTAH